VAFAEEYDDGMEELLLDSIVAGATGGTQDLLNHPYKEPFHLPIEIFRCRET
jgi:hypothetical protein